MKTIYKSIVVALLCVTAAAQNAVPILDSTYVAKNVSYFTIENGEIKGDGLRQWQRIIDESQFLAYGERHGSKATSELFEALLPMTTVKGYNNFIIEVGPYSAKKLVELSKTPENTVGQLSKFLMKYGNLKYRFQPIPFFSGVEDARFLQKAAEANMNIIGIDQEYYNAAPFLFDELLKLVEGHKDYDEIKSLHTEAKARVNYWYETEETSEEDISAYTEILKEASVNGFLDKMSSINDNAKDIVEALKTSWDIYIRWRNDSHVDRISYMRNNFISHYNSQLKEETTPKFVMKFGALHISKSYSNNAYDLGHLVTELAEKNNTKASIINSWTRYYTGNDGKVIDYLKAYTFYRRYRELMCFGNKTQWVIIDLTAIRNDIAKGKVRLPNNGDYHKLRYLIDSYDYQLILPQDTMFTINIGN